MGIDRSNFLVIAGALAAGGVGGWSLRDRSPRPVVPATPLAPAPPKRSAASSNAPVEVELVERSGAGESAACDDSVGTPAECPSVGPADEGICPDLIFKRCGEFKAAFKPKVAQRAVDCLRQLKANERCDAARIQQCGHAALMAACVEPPPAAKATFQPASGTRPASVTLAEDPSAVVSPVTLACRNLVKSCGDQPLGPTLSDCRQTLSGLSDTGRANMIECVAAHCADRGLLGCEAVQKPASVAGSAAR